MFRKNYYLIILTIALLLSGSIAAVAQATVEITGNIVLKKADDTTEPVAGASIEVLRIDKKAIFPAVKTDDKGNFTVSGIPDEGEYVVSVSGEKIKPEVSTMISAGTKNVIITVLPGDGRKYTEEQIRQAIAKAGELSPEERKKREELEAKNKKAEAANAVVSKALEEGVKAFEAKNYDVAIVKFEEGYQASPDFIGSAPPMLNNKAMALVKRAVDNYNKMLQTKDQTLRPKVNKDFEDAIAALSLSLKVMKSASPEEIAKIQKNFDVNKTQMMLGAQDAVNLMNRTESVSEAKKAEVIELMNEYVAFEKDQKKKVAGQADLAVYLQKANDYDAAIAEFRKAAAMSPNDPDVIGGLGLALYTVAYESEDTAKKQEALNYMQHFLDIAPKDHKLRDGIDGGVEDLKSQKLKPQKISAKN